MSELQRCPMNSFGADPEAVRHVWNLPYGRILTAAIGGSC
jgi:hypothetical protein